MRIAIIGGGISGLTTAIALRNKGFAPVVYEKISELGEVGAGIWLAPNALKVLDFLGVGDEVKKAGHPLSSVEITNQKLQAIRSSKDNYFSDQLGNKTIAIHRARLQQILYDHVPKEQIFFGQSFTKIEKQQERVLIDFTSGYQEFDLVLGADGIHSQVREWIHPNAHKRYSGQTCWRGISEMNLNGDWQGAGREAWGKEIRFGFSPISDKEVYWFAVKNEASGGVGPENIKSYLTEMYSDFHPLVNEIISHTQESKIIRNDLFDLEPFNGWSKGSIGLIGDAAHATTPNMGQGACQGIEDAYYISKILAESRKETEQVLKEFEKFRKSKVNYIVNNSWRFGQLVHRPSSQFILKTLMKLTPSKIMEKQMSRLYEVEGL